MVPGFSRAAKISILVQFCVIAVAFQRPSAEPDGGTQPFLRVDSSLVLIPVRVTAASGASVTGLKKEDFELSEDGVRQTITHFAQDDAPVSAGVLLDISGSMKNKMAKASEAASAFFQFANPEDEFFLVEFNSRPKLTVPFTADWPQLSREIAKAKGSGLTALVDAIHFGIAQMKKARNPRKALIILSDGGENFSRRNFRQLRTALIESDVQVYALGVFDKDYPVRHTREERNGPTLLSDVALDSGGREFPVGRAGDLPEIGVQIARLLRNQYILGYTPVLVAADGKYHRVNLKLTAPNNGLRADYRRGYYAPAR